MNELQDLDASTAGEGAHTDRQRILRMTPDGKTSSSIEVNLRKRIEDLAQAIRDKDVDRLMTLSTSAVAVCC